MEGTTRTGSEGKGKEKLVDSTAENSLETLDLKPPHKNRSNSNKNSLRHPLPEKPSNNDLKRQHQKQQTKGNTKSSIYLATHESSSSKASIHTEEALATQMKHMHISKERVKNPNNHYYDTNNNNDNVKVVHCYNSATKTMEKKLIPINVGPNSSDLFKSKDSKEKQKIQGQPLVETIESKVIDTKVVEIHPKVL